MSSNQRNLSGLPRQQPSLQRNNEISISKQSLGKPSYIVSQGVGASKAFLYKQQALKNDPKGYLNKGSVSGSASKLDRNGNVIPNSVMMHNNNVGQRLPHSPGRRFQEEQKRANSVASGDTIISTASSSSPMKKGLQMKRNLQINGL